MTITGKRFSPKFIVLLSIIQEQHLRSNYALYLSNTCCHCPITLSAKYFCMISITGKHLVESLLDENFNI